MDALGNLDSFIAGCDATKMGAFLELVQRRFSEAQLQRQKKLESVVSNMHKQLLEASAAKKQQLREQIGSSLAALSSKRDAAAAELTQSLEAARAKKQQLLLSFQEQEKACQVGGADLGFFQEIEDEVKELTSLFVAKQQEMGEDFFKSFEK
ncbi:hypothetical protein, conserved [Eimeria tenella]|uniref:Uncharacterized protein n=1 Tax=Eimeria tenella TaxID=5802 RepID=U6L4K7_EIMTE|nr:hypothetical protein, conserved [Eimeria tenella]CDJ44143.1 hypothetical protein, conserved [Eimeria tenella]|eukprot:XP_013234892.1 hypothetical protein, conserved [Eimeria tenella]